MDPFKRYDIRGRLGIDLDEGVAHRIAQAFARVTGANAVVLARDCRESSPALADAVAAGLVAQGCRVLDLGLAGTEEMYFATAHLGAGGGIMVTASHNPRDYNGMKLVGPGAVPLSDADFAQVQALSAQARHQIFEGNARRVFPRLGNRSARAVNGAAHHA